MSSLRFLPRFANNRLYGGKDLLREISSAAARVHFKLTKIDLQVAGISEYNQRYLGTEISNSVGNWPINVHMLGYLLSTVDVPRNQAVLLDYGGGSGTISFLAKELGVGTVIYNDIYDISCQDARIIGEALCCSADHYVEGDLPHVIDYMRQAGLICDMLGSHDCIEHIYDIETFLRCVSKVSKVGTALWLSSAANSLRSKTRRTLAKVQMRSEHEDRESTFGHKRRDTLRSFLSIRREIIRNKAANLGENEVEILAKRTRGMRSDDIVKVVESYTMKGAIPPEPNHPTNTCDPFTGNWAERLMDPFELRRILAEEDFDIEVRPGYWDPTRKPKWKALAKDFTNFCISVLGSRGLRISPYYVICGVYGKDTVSRGMSASTRK